MHLLFYYHLACILTLCFKNPLSGMISGFPLMWYFEDSMLVVWATIAGSITAAAATKATNGKLINWKVALLQLFIAIASFAITNLYDYPVWIIPLILLVGDFMLLDKDFWTNKTLWSTGITFTCLTIFVDNYKMQLNMLAATSLFLTIMILKRFQTKKKKQNYL